MIDTEIKNIRYDGDGLEINWEFSDAWHYRKKNDDGTWSCAACGKVFGGPRAAGECCYSCKDIGG